MPKRLTTEEYNAFLKEKYPTIILTSEYCGDKNYITVKCAICGHEWKTKPVWIRQGRGCKNCYDLRRGNSTRKSQEEFLNDAKHVHGEKYLYDKVLYRNDSDKIIITCPEHGDFEQTPNKHLRGHGCPICAIKENGIRKRLGIAEFLKRAKEIHGERYIYPEGVHYENVETAVPIICRKHGLFMQTPSVHLNGGGCPLCRSSHLEQETEKYLNFSKIEYEHQKRFKWLGKQSLDFYLPELNIAIECQGLQHFRKIYSKRKDDTFLTRQYDIIKRRDIKKNELCSNHGVQILYVTNLPKKTAIFSDAPIYSEDNLFFDMGALGEKILKYTYFCMKKRSKI